MSIIAKILNHPSYNHSERLFHTDLFPVLHGFNQTCDLVNIPQDKEVYKFTHSKIDPTLYKTCIHLNPSIGEALSFDNINVDRIWLVPLPVLGGGARLAHRRINIRDPLVVIDEIEILLADVIARIFTNMLYDLSTDIALFLSNKSFDSDIFEREENHRNRHKILSEVYLKIYFNATVNEIIYKNIAVIESTFLAILRVIHAYDGQPRKDALLDALHAPDVLERAHHREGEGVRYTYRRVFEGYLSVLVSHEISHIQHNHRNINEYKRDENAEYAFPDLKLTMAQEVEADFGYAVYRNLMRNKRMAGSVNDNAFASLGASVFAAVRSFAAEVNVCRSIQGQLPQFAHWLGAGLLLAHSKQISHLFDEYPTEIERSTLWRFIPVFILADLKDFDTALNIIIRHVLMIHIEGGIIDFIFESASEENIGKIIQPSAIPHFKADGVLTRFRNFEALSPEERRALTDLYQRADAGSIVDALNPALMEDNPAVAKLSAMFDERDNGHAKSP